MLEELFVFTEDNVSFVFVSNVSQLFMVCSFFFPFK